MFSTEYGVFTNPPRYTTNPTLIKKAGGTNFAVLGYSISPSSSVAATNASISLKAAGFTVGYLNNSLPFGTVNVTAVALQMKAAGVNSMEAEIDGNTELALITAGDRPGSSGSTSCSRPGTDPSGCPTPRPWPAARGCTSGSSRCRRS